MIPAHQRLQSDHPPTHQVDLGLEGKRQLRALDRFIQVVFEQIEIELIGFHLQFENDTARPSHRLGVVKRQVGAPQQIADVAAMARRDGDSD